MHVPRLDTLIILTANNHTVPDSYEGLLLVFPNAGRNKIKEDKDKNPTWHTR